MVMEVRKAVPTGREVTEARGGSGGGAALGLSVWVLVPRP